MKKLCMMTLAAFLSVGVASLGYAQAPATEKKAEEKKGDAKGDMKGDAKAEKKAPAKKAEKKDDKKMDDKKAANPCAAKAPEKK
jgi:hypothetical protein